MRRLLSFSCAGLELGATLDEAAGPIGVLMVTGGTQTRIGSHRMYERLALELARNGHSCFRFDRRGVGDSDGADPGYEGSRDDLVAAAQAFRSAVPHVGKMIGFGLCDGATALALFGAEARLDGFILANPWLVEASAGAPPATYVRRHYREQLLNAGAWRRALTGRISYRKAIAGLRRAVRPAPSTLAGRVAEALRQARLPVALLVARRDPTAIAAEAEWRKMQAGAEPVWIDSDSHTFARPGDREALLAGCLAAITSLRVD